MAAKNPAHRRCGYVPPEQLKPTRRFHTKNGGHFFDKAGAIPLYKKRRLRYNR